MWIALLAIVFVAVAFVPAAEAQTALTFSKAFAPSTIGPGSVSTLRFDITNNTSSPLTGLTFTDNLPAGVTIATPANASTDCFDATLTTPDGGDTITFSGGRVGGAESCIVTVDVTSSTPGVHTNVSGALISGTGSSGTATADLTVVADRPGFSKSFNPSTVSFGERSTLTFTIDNSANSSAAYSLTFTDNLPSGMVVANPANAATSCTGGTLSAVGGSSVISYSGFTGDASVAAGGTCTVTVDVVANSAGALNNISGELTSTPSQFGGTAQSSGAASATLTATAEDIALIKEFVDDPVAPGGTAILEFRIRNLDRGFDATSIAFDDDLEAVLTGLAPNESLPKAACNGTLDFSSGVLSLSGGTISTEGECTFNVSLGVPAGASDGAYPNTTSAVTADINGGSVTGNSATDTLYVSAAPVLTKEFLDVDSAASDPEVNAGDDVTLRFTVTNPSSSTATAIAFIDELTDGSGGFPPDLTTGFLPFPVSATLPVDPEVCGAGSSLALVSVSTDRQGLSLSGGNLAAGDTCTFDVTLSIPSDLGPGIYLNTTEEITATVDGATRTGDPASDTLTVIGAPKLTKAFADDPVAAGGTVTLEFTLTHSPDASGDATDIAFTDDLTALTPALVGLAATGLPLTEACDPDGPGGNVGTGTLSESGGVLTFLGGALSPGESCAFGVTLAVPSDAAAGSYANTTSSVSATVGGLTVTSPQAADDLEVQGLALTKEFTDDPAIAGGSVTLRYSIANTSASSSATDIFFRDDLDDALDNLAATTLPAGVTACGAVASLTGLSGNTVLQFEGGSLSAGESCTFDVVLQVPAGAADGTYKSITNLFSATFDGTPTVFDNARDDLTVLSDFLLLAKEFTDDPVAPGDTVTLEFTLSNLGGGQITAIGFTDDLVGALPGLSSSSGTLNGVCGAGSSIGGTTLLTFSGGTLDSGTSCTFSVTVSVDIGVANGTVATNTVSDAQGVLGGQTVFADAATADLVISDPRDVPLTIESVVVAPEPSLEGQTVAASATFTGGAGGTLCTVDYGDGSGPVAGSVSDSVCTGPDHVYGDNGVYTVTVTVTDSTETDSETASHTVNNVAPTVSAPATSSPSDEGSAVTATSAFSDPGFNDSPFGCTVDYGEGAGPEPGSVSGSICTGPPHIYGDNGSYTVIVSVTDKDGGVGSASSTHTVNNVAPSVTAPVVTPEPSNEGDAVTASADFADPGFDDSPFTCTVDYGDGAGPVAGTVAGLTCSGPSHTYGDNGVFPVTVAVTDKDGGFGSASSDHQVDNVAPTVTLDTSGAVAFPGGDAFIGRQGVPQEHQADGNDPGSDDLTFRWDFSGQIVTTTYYNDTGDPAGTPDEFPSSAGTFPFSITDTATVTFAGPGAFEVSIELSDDDGGFDSQALAKLVTGDQVCVRSHGFWRHQFTAKNPHFDEETLQAFLDFVNAASLVFSEEVDAVDPAAAGDVFDTKKTKRDKANLEALAAWLNIASGAAAVDDVIEFDDGSTETVLDVMFMVEAILLDPNASDADLTYAKDLAEAVNYLVNEKCEESSFQSLFNYGIEVEFANGCWAAYIPSPDDCIDCKTDSSSGESLLLGVAKVGGESCSAYGGTYLKILDQRLEWQITNTGAESITIDRISLFWPQHYGDLRKISLRNATIFDHVVRPASTIVEGGWRGTVMDRQIEPGVTKKLKLEFGNTRGPETREHRPE